MVTAPSETTSAPSVDARGRSSGYEVASIPREQRQDPTFFRTNGEQIGRDGCRVPLPWIASGPSFGFGDGTAHLPQPAWFAEFAADVEARDPHSTLSLYRRALALRRELQTAQELRWSQTDRDDVVSFVRPNGWRVVSNFGSEPYALALTPGERVALTSGLLSGEELPGEATAWVVSVG